MEMCDHEAYYLRYVKVALASVLLKHKPSTITAKEYTEQLMIMLKDKDEETDKKIQELTSEVFRAKQELLKAQVATQAELSIHDTGYQLSDITPPSSSEDDDKKQKEVFNNIHRQIADFLKQISFLYKTQQPFSFTGDNVVMETHHIIQLLTQGDAMFSLPNGILQSCIRGILDIVKLSSLSKFPTELKAAISRLVEHLLDGMTRYGHQDTDKIAKLLVSMGRCHHIRDDVLNRLTSRIFEFSSKLRDVIHEHRTLRSCVLEYETVYIVMWTFEQILTDDTLHAEPCPQEVKHRLTAVMEDSAVHTSRSFPVFTAFIWRLQRLLADCQPHKRTDE